MDSCISKEDDKHICYILSYLSAYKVLLWKFIFWGRKVHKKSKLGFVSSNAPHPLAGSWNQWVLPLLLVIWLTSGRCHTKIGIRWASFKKNAHQWYWQWQHLDLNPASDVFSQTTVEPNKSFTFLESWALVNISYFLKKGWNYTLVILK